MKKWVIGTVIILAGAIFGVTWYAKRCYARRPECQATATTEPFFPLPPLIVGDPNSPTKEKDSHDQKQGTKNDTSCFYCGVVATENLPTVYLVLIGIGGVIVGVATLKALVTQTEATRDSARATERNVELQEMQLRQWVDVEDWDGRCDGLEFTKPEPTLNVTFKIWNHTSMPLTLKRVEGEINGQRLTSVVNHTLTPNHSYPFTFPIGLRGANKIHYGENRLVIVFDGRVTYEDAANRKSEQPVAHMFICGPYEETDRT